MVEKNQEVLTQLRQHRADDGELVGQLNAQVTALRAEVKSAKLLQSRTQEAQTKLQDDLQQERFKMDAINVELSLVKLELNFVKLTSKHQQDCQEAELANTTILCKQQALQLEACQREADALHVEAARLEQEKELGFQRFQQAKTALRAKVGGGGKDFWGPKEHFWKKNASWLG